MIQRCVPPQAPPPHQQVGTGQTWCPGCRRSWRSSPAVAPSAHRSPEQLPWGARARQLAQPGACPAPAPQTRGGGGGRVGHAGVSRRLSGPGWVRQGPASRDGCGQHHLTRAGAAPGRDGGAGRGVRGQSPGRCGVGASRQVAVGLSHPQHHQPGQLLAAGRNMSTDSHMLKI